MNKYIVAEVRPASEYANDLADAYVTKLDEVTISRIKKLAEAVIDNNLYCAQFFYSAGEWYIGDVDDLDKDAFLNDPETACDSHFSGSFDVEGELLEVQNGMFRFNSIEKHGGDTSLQQSAWIPISELENDSALIVSTSF